MEILYETKDLIVFIKPVGMLSEEEGNKQSVPKALKEYLEGKGVKNAEVFTVHRLDRDVSGVMVVAKNKKTASKLAIAVSERQIEKEYLAVVKGIPFEKEGVLKDLLFRDAAKGKTYVTDRMRKGVRDAALSYKLLETKELDGQPFSLVRIKLHTGRTHQIRVQFASRKMPLWGDGRYGSADGKSRPALFSCRLALEGLFDCVAMPSSDPFVLFDSVLKGIDFENEPFPAFCIN